MFDPPSFSWKTWKGTYHSDCGKFLPTWLCSDTEWQTAVDGQRSEYSRRLKQEGATKESGCSSSPWMTPRSSDGEHGGPNQRGSRGDVMLPSQTAQWLTPRASAVDESPETFVKRMGDRTANCFGSLESQSRHWYTPNVPNGGRVNPDNMSDTGQLANFVAHSPHQAQTTQADGNTSLTDGQTSRQRLNVKFAEWLLRWPEDWTCCRCAAIGSTACALSETALIEKQQQEPLQPCISE